ncbi:hypothetical protein RND71_021919 [Anisodus tanguticus]|uniref:RING-type domain-containing protein n=1 Tax=Anisodus tanguticus TaxID=243964 RepID=A0AAE1RXF7_9SOLA|nr:hypothetical protein RND71_021919 [Anisodus tanguticus]
MKKIQKRVPGNQNTTTGGRSCIVAGAQPLIADVAPSADLWRPVYAYLVQLEHGLHGLEPLAVANFPTKKYGDVFFTSAEDAQCIVCLAEYQEKDALRFLPICGHSFHATCIDIWFQQHSTCPVCRISLRETPEKKRFMQPLFSSAIGSHYAMDSLNVGSNCCLSAEQRHSPRLHDDSLRTELTTDAQCPPEGGMMVVRGNDVILNEDSHNTKNSENKQVESPSNA